MGIKPSWESLIRTELVPPGHGQVSCASGQDLMTKRYAPSYKDDDSGRQRDLHRLAQWHLNAIACLFLVMSHFAQVRGKWLGWE